MFVYVSEAMFLAILEEALLLTSQAIKMGGETFEAETYTVSSGQHVSKQNRQYSARESAKSCIDSLFNMEKSVASSMV